MPKPGFAALAWIRYPQNRCEELGGAARPLPQPQSAYSPLTVVCTCFGCRLRVANAFDVVRTAHALPDLALQWKEPFVGCYHCIQPTPQASSPSGGGSWHVVPDGRGNCKAMGTAVLCLPATPTPNRHTAPLQHPQSPDGDSLRPATSVGVQPTNRGLHLLRLSTAGR